LPTISRSVRTLVERGWVSHRASQSDRRVVIAELTPAGHEVLADVRAQALDRLEEMLGQLSQDELDKLACAFDVLEEVLPAAARPWTD
jgi:DNA-binding MarR family transcriptional regulator